jgi:hypothetical protein
MKKTITQTLAIALTLGALYSPPSKAAVSMVTGSTALLMVGLLGGSGGGLIVAAAQLPFEIWGLVTIAGVVILDGEEGRTVEFTAISPEGAKKLGITKEERLSYNSELDQVNFLLSEVNDDIQSSTKDSKASERAWASVKDMVAPATYSTLTKIAKSMAKK